MSSERLVVSKHSGDSGGAPHSPCPHRCLARSPAGPEPHGRHAGDSHRSPAASVRTTGLLKKYVCAVVAAVLESKSVLEFQTFTRDPEHGVR